MVWFDNLKFAVVGHYSIISKEVKYLYNSVAEKNALLKQDNYARYLDSLEINIRDFGHRTGEQLTPDKEQICSNFVLLYIAKGRLRMEYRNSVVAGQANGVFLIEPLTAYRCSADGEQPLEYYFIECEIEPFYRYDEITHMLASQDSTYWRDECLSHLLPLFSYTYQRFQRDDAKAALIMIKSILNLAIVEIINLAFSETISPIGLSYGDNFSKDMETVKRFTKLIGQNIDSHIKIADICKQMGISESYLYKVFKKVMKMAPIKYLALYKLDRAKKLLRSNLYSVTEISQMLGYSSVFHFSASFKSVLGVTPSQYAKLHES